jgi:hypothetical protein
MIKYLGPLTAHPSLPPVGHYQILAQVRISQSDRLCLRYAIEGDVSTVRLGQARPPQRADRLWEHTCFEAFVRTPAGAGYYELNFAPSLEWSVFEFRAYRAGLSLPAMEEPPHVAARVTDQGFALDAVIALTELRGLRGAPRIDIGLSAVIEEVDGTLSYWALRHPAGRADFHDPAGFAIELAVQVPT